MNKNYVDIDYYEKEVKKSPFFYPTIEDVVYNKDIINYIVKENIKSMKKGEEDLYYRCNQKLIYPKKKSKSNEVTFKYDIDNIIHKCYGNDISLFHFHGIYPSHFSNQDNETFKSFIPSGFKDSGVAGVDGIRFMGFLGNSFYLPFTKDYYDELKEKGIRVINPVTDVSCTKFTHKKNDRIKCNIVKGERLGETNLIIDKVIIEDLNLNKNTYPFRWLDINTLTKYNHVQFNFSDGYGMCTLYEDKKKRKKTLTCFDKKTDL